MIRTGAEVPDGFEVHTEVCVVGSGAGGGVVAALAAEAGREVFVLEEGPQVRGVQMTQREEEMYPLLYRDGGQQMTVDGGISVLQGRVLGGSTVVNNADVVGIADEVLGHWRQHFGLDRWTVVQVREAEAACREAIGANRIPEEEINRNNALLLEGARKLGMDGGAFIHNRVGCIGSGYCLVGCAYDAKRSVALTWIPRALATGRAAVQTDARVEHLEWTGGRVTAVSGSIVAHPSLQPIAPFRITADEFVLSAGAIHSPLLLLGAGIGGDQVGRNLSLQPQTPAVAIYPDEVVLFRGIPQSSYVDSTEEFSVESGIGGFRLEGVSATPGQAASTTALDPADLHEFMARFRNVAACLCLVSDRPSGRVTRDGNGRPKIQYTLTEAVEATLRESVRAAGRCYLASGAETVMLPFPDATPVHDEAGLAQLDHLRIRAASTPLVSAHPQGTCRMGPDPARSVVGLDGRVHGMDNLRVLDASVFPTTASSHTMLPTMTIAWLGTQGLLS